MKKLIGQQVVILRMDGQDGEYGPDPRVGAKYLTASCFRLTNDAADPASGGVNTEFATPLAWVGPPEESYSESMGVFRRAGLRPGRVNRMSKNGGNKAIRSLGEGLGRPLILA